MFCEPFRERYCRNVELSTASSVSTTTSTSTSVNFVKRLFTAEGSSEQESIRTHAAVIASRLAVTNTPERSFSVRFRGIAGNNVDDEIDGFCDGGNHMPGDYILHTALFEGFFAIPGQDKNCFSSDSISRLHVNQFVTDDERLFQVEPKLAFPSSEHSRLRFSAVALRDVWRDAFGRMVRAVINRVQCCPFTGKLGDETVVDCMEICFG